MREKEKRLVVRTESSENLLLRRYESLKWDGEGWHEKGREYSIKGVHNLLAGNAVDVYDFYLEEAVAEDLRDYQKEKVKKNVLEGLEVVVEEAA
jgi:hypothetical protein